MSLAEDLAAAGILTLHARHGERTVLASRWVVELDGRAWLPEDDAAKAGVRPTRSQLDTIRACRAAHDPEADRQREEAARALRRLWSERAAILDALLGDPRALRAAALKHGYPIPEVP